MGLINLDKILIVKPIDLDIFLAGIGTSLTNTSELYALTLIIANIFAYLFLFLFILSFFMVIRSLKRRIRRIFT